MSINVNRFINYWDIFRLAKKQHKTVQQFLTTLFMDVGVKSFKMIIHRGAETIETTDWEMLREGDLLSFVCSPIEGFFQNKEIKYTKNAIYPDFEQGVVLDNDTFEITREVLEEYVANDGMAWQATAELKPDVPTDGTNIMVYAPEEGGTVECAWVDYATFKNNGYKITEFKPVTPGGVWNEGKIDKVAKMSTFSPLKRDVSKKDETNHICTTILEENFEIFCPYITVKVSFAGDPYYIKLSPGKTSSELNVNEYILDAADGKLQFKISENDWSLLFGEKTTFNADVYAISKTNATEKGLTTFKEYMFATRTRWETPSYVFIDWNKSKAVNIKGTVATEQNFFEVYELCEYSETKPADYRGIYNSTIIDDLGYERAPSEFDLFFGGWIIAPQFLKHSNILITNVSVDYTARDDGTSPNIHDIVVGKQAVDLDKYEFYNFNRDDDISFKADEYFELTTNTYIPTGRTFKYASVNFYNLLNPQYDKQGRQIPFHNWKVENYNVAEGEDESFRDISLRSVRGQLDDKDIIHMEFKRDDTKTSDAYDNLRFTKRIPVAHWSQPAFYPEWQTDDSLFAFYKGGQTCNIAYYLDEEFDPASHEETQKSVADIVEPTKIGCKDIYSPYETVFDKYDKFENIPDRLKPFPSKENLYQITLTAEKIKELENKGRTYKMFYELKQNGSNGLKNNMLIAAYSKYGYYNGTCKAFEYDIAFEAYMNEWKKIDFQDGSSKISVQNHWNNTIAYNKNLYIDESESGQGVTNTRMIIKLKEAFPAGVYLSPYAPVVRVRQNAEGHDTERTIYWYEFTKQDEEAGYEGGVYYCPINYKTEGGSCWELTGTYFVSLEPSRDIENLVQCNIKVDPYLANKGSTSVVLYCDKPDDWFDPAGQTHVPYEFQLDTTTGSKHNTGFVIRAYDDFSILVNLPACPAATMAERKGVVLCYSSTGLWNDAQEVIDEQTGDIIELQPKISQAKWDDESNKVVVWGTLSLKDQKTLLNQIKTDSQDPSKKPTLYLNYYRV